MCSFIYRRKTLCATPAEVLVNLVFVEASARYEDSPYPESPLVLYSTTILDLSEDC
jgi:hypothetical protein